jgi:hypothetical protein
MENKPLTEEKAIPKPELGCGSAYDCFYRLDVISAKRLLKSTNDEIFEKLSQILRMKLHNKQAKEVADLFRRLRDNPDACFQIPDNSENCKDTNKVSNPDGDDKK